jgi:hypothetical protein
VRPPAAPALLAGAWSGYLRLGAGGSPCLCVVGFEGPAGNVRHRRRTAARVLRSAAPTRSAGEPVPPGNGILNPGKLVG